MTHEHFNLALTQEAVSAAVPDREYLIWRDRRFTYRQLTEGSRRLASFLHQRGLGAHTERDRLLATNLATCLGSNPLSSHITMYDVG